MIKKIVIVNDFIRDAFFEGNYAEKGCKALQTLLSYQLNKSTQLKTETIFDCIDFEKFMKLNGLDKEEKITWPYFFNNITKKAENYLIEELKDTVVIGYHLTNLIVDVLNRNNIPFIDTFETAYRYMQDSYFGFRTNVQGAKNYLLENSLSINTMHVYANYLKAFYIKKEYSDVDDNSCLLVGQTGKDSVLIKNDNMFVSLEEYKEKIIEISKQYKTLYYKMHPLEPLDSSIKNFLESIPNSCEETRNFYELMSQENIKEVIGLNSGALYEAKFFGKKTTFLFSKYHSYYQDGADKDDYKTFIIINSNSHIFKINFWAKILSSVVPTYKVSDSDEIYFDNYQSLLASYLRISSGYELNIYSIYEIKRSMKHINNDIMYLYNTSEALEDKMNYYEDKMNYYEFLLKKKSNRHKKLFLNVILGFVPSKNLRKKLRNYYIKY